MFLEFFTYYFLTEENLETKPKTSYITAKALVVSYCREVIKRVSWKYTLKLIEISQLLCFRAQCAQIKSLSSFDLFQILILIEEKLASFLIEI